MSSFTMAHGYKSCWRLLFLLVCDHASRTLAARFASYQGIDDAADVGHDAEAVLAAMRKTWATADGSWPEAVVHGVQHGKIIPLNKERHPDCKVDVLQNINGLLEPLRKNLPKDPQEITKLFQHEQGQQTASKSGSDFIGSSGTVLSPDNKQWMLKSEDSNIESLLTAFTESYVDRIDRYEEDTCLKSRMVRIGLAFKLKCHGSEKIWIMMADVNPKPPAIGVPYVKFDLKHSRELARCHRHESSGSYKGLSYVIQNPEAPDTDRMGYVGDFLAEFEDSIAWSLTKANPDHEKVKEKHMCWLRAVHMDAVVLKKPGSKSGTRLLDYSILIVVQPYDPSIEDDSSVFDIGPYHWSSADKPMRLHMVMGVIDLFKQKGFGTKTQDTAMSISHHMSSIFASAPSWCPASDTYLFNHKKFESYSEFFYCLASSTVDPGEQYGGVDQACGKADWESLSKPMDKWGLKALLAHDKSAPLSEEETCKLLNQCRSFLHRGEAGSKVAKLSSHGREWLNRCRGEMSSNYLIGHGTDPGANVVINKAFLAASMKGSYASMNAAQAAAVLQAPLIVSRLIKSERHSVNESNMFGDEMPCGADFATIWFETSESGGSLHCIHDIVKDPYTCGNGQRAGFFPMAGFLAPPAVKTKGDVVQLAYYRTSVDRFGRDTDITEIKLEFQVLDQADALGSIRKGPDGRTLMPGRRKKETQPVGADTRAAAFGQALLTIANCNPWDASSKLKCKPLSQAGKTSSGKAEEPFKPEEGIYLELSS